ncbi:MAG: ABC transporter ATP-binding protein [Cyanobacteriota bacterium]|nr:ABC transporter ATP-binding protein [Cyanobacteriota bacterium]
MPDFSRARYGTLLRLLWKHITPQRRFQLLLLVALMLLSSVAELLSVASLVPFLAALSDPAGLWRQPWVRGVAEGLGFSGPQQLILPMSLLLMAAGVASAAIRAANLAVNARMASLIGSDLSIEAYRRSLGQPYAVHLSRNSSEVITRLEHLGLISRGVLAPMLLGLAGLLVAVQLVTVLLFYQPGLAIGLAILFSLVYGSLVRLNRRRLHRLSLQANILSQQALKAQQEGLGAIRDILLDGSQEMVVANFGQAERPLRLVEGETDTLAGLPRYALEAAGMVGIAGSVLWLLPRGGVVAALPAVGAIALGFQRLLPAVQQMYGASTYLGAYRDRLVAGLELLEQPQPTRGTEQQGTVASLKPLPFQRELTFRGVEFCHQEGHPVLQSIDLSVRQGEWIGLVGPTGSGKSTLLDLLMGLLSPSKGEILVDGVMLEDHDAGIDRRSAWQRHLAHVPQTIYLADASIGANIAFGVAPEQINHDRLIWAAKAAQAADFIAALPQSFRTPVGERGVRLSGGQRQRLGIARALYKQTDVLILDEATSALDTVTEKAVIDSLWRIGKGLTVVMVAHRLSTLSSCQRIIQLQQGKINAIGSYDELLDTNSGSLSLADRPRTS